MGSTCATHQYAEADQNDMDVLLTLLAGGRAALDGHSQLGRHHVELPDQSFMMLYRRALGLRAPAFEALAGDADLASEPAQLTSKLPATFAEGALRRVS
jgi:hypothetical protein